MKCIKITDDNFPQVLRHIPDPPQQIYVLGDLAPLLETTRLAIVGTRKVTDYGRHVTEQLARESALHDITVVSGLALGVDAIAHQAGLAVSGKAIAVLASGLDKITPATNYRLGQQLLRQGGAIVSEYPPGTPIHKTNFIARNRIVSGLSDGVLITEAALKSGTWHTANFALDQGKTVMAVPGNITSPMSVGTNNLIRSGALPVTEIKDVLLALGLSDKPRQLELLAIDPDEAAILAILYKGHQTTATLLQCTQLAPAAFNQALTLLEVTGRVYLARGGRWAIK